MYDDLCVVMTENVFMLSLCSHMYIMSSLFSAFLSPALSDHSSCDNQGTQGCITCKKYERRYMDIHRGVPTFAKEVVFLYQTIFVWVWPSLHRWSLQRRRRSWQNTHLSWNWTLGKNLLLNLWVYLQGTWIHSQAQFSAQETHHHWVRMKSLWVIKWRAIGEKVLTSIGHSVMVYIISRDENECVCYCSIYYCTSL